MNNHDTGVAIVWPAQIKSIEMREGGSLIRTGRQAGRQVTPFQTNITVSQ